MWPMGIMARDTVQRVTLLKTTALTQIGDLVRNVIILRMLNGERLVVFLQRFTGPIAEGRTPIIDGVAVTLRADLNLTFAGQMSGVYDGVGLFAVAMGLVIVHMVPTGTVASLTRDTRNMPLPPKLIEAARDVFRPGVVTLKTPRSQRARVILRSIGVEESGSPLAAIP